MRLDISFNCFLCLVWFLYLNYVNGQNTPAPPPGGYYTTRYDHIDIERILNQKRLVHYYTECLLERGPCTPQGIEFKRILPEALKTNCARCTEKQRFVTLKSIKRLKKEYPNVWAELSAIWDPTGEYVQRLEDSLNRKPNRSPEILAAVINPVNQINPINDVPAPKPSENIAILTRFGDDQESENLPSPKPQIQAETAANTIANKPISFSSTTSTTTTTTTTTTQQPIITSTTTRRQTSTPNLIQRPSTVKATSSVDAFKTTTKNIFTSMLQDRIPVTTSRISYNYDFAATVRPVRPLHQIPATGINMVIKGVNNIIQPISDIAGRVITAGTDIAGIVLNALGVRRTY